MVTHAVLNAADQAVSSSSPDQFDFSVFFEPLFKPLSPGYLSIVQHVIVLLIPAVTLWRLLRTEDKVNNINVNVNGRIEQLMALVSEKSVRIGHDLGKRSGDDLDPEEVKSVVRGVIADASVTLPTAPATPVDHLGESLPTDQSSPEETR